MTAPWGRHSLCVRMDVLQSMERASQKASVRPGNILRRSETKIVVRFIHEGDTAMDHDETRNLAAFDCIVGGNRYRFQLCGGKC
jgi:hypothetical protein